MIPDFRNDGPSAPSKSYKIGGLQHLSQLFSADRTRRVCIELTETCQDGLLGLAPHGPRPGTEARYSAEDVVLFANAKLLTNANPQKTHEDAISITEVAAQSALQCFYDFFAFLHFEPSCHPKYKPELPNTCKHHMAAW